MTTPKTYIVFKQQQRQNRLETVFAVIAPVGEIYCAFDLQEAIRFKDEAKLYRRRYGK
jgi:hypothetical protein